MNECIICRELTAESTIIRHHEVTNIDEVCISLELWDSHRESHEESVLIVDTSVVLEEHRDTRILVDDTLRVEFCHEIEREMFIDDIRTHHLDDSRYLRDLLEEHSYDERLPHSNTLTEHSIYYSIYYDEYEDECDDYYDDWIHREQYI